MPASRQGRSRRAGQAGAGLVEVMIAVTVLVVVALGATALAVSGRLTVARADQQRTAAQVAQEYLDRTRTLAYGAIVNATGTVAVDGITYTYTLTVANATADPGDAGSIYKQLTVSVNWPTSGGIPVTLQSAVSP